MDDHVDDHVSQWERQFGLLCARIAGKHPYSAEVEEVVRTKATPGSILSWAAHCSLAQVWRDAGTRVPYTEVLIPDDFSIEECIRGAYADLVQICRNPNVINFVSNADRIEVNTRHIIVECSHRSPDGVQKHGRRDVGAMDIVMKPAVMIQKEKSEGMECPGLHFKLRESTYLGDGGKQRPALMQSIVWFPGGFCFGERKSYVAYCAYGLWYALIINEALFAFTLTGGTEESILTFYPAVGKDSIEIEGAENA